MGLTTDRTDPCLNVIEDDGQQACYLILSEEERAKGFIRPLRSSYVHVGQPGPDHPLIDLTPEQKETYRDKYVKYEPYPEGSHGLGRFWKQEQLDKIGIGCGALTKMGLALCETAARNPFFYGATWCVGCGAHIPVEEFIWDEDGQRMGT